MRPRIVGCLLILFAFCVTSRAWGHAMNMTRVMVTSPAPQQVTLVVDIDLSLILGSYQRYSALLTEPVASQKAQLVELGRQVLRELGVKVDGAPVEVDPGSWTLPDAPPEKIGDQTTAAMTTFRFERSLPPGDHELTVNPPAMSKIEFPLAYTFSIPAQKVLMTRWLELPGSSSRVMKLAAAPVPASASSATAFLPSKPVEATATATATAPATATLKSSPEAAEFSPFELGVARFVSTFLQHLALGFKHIMPRGADHILFVLGLFFLGAKWRPLISQTTAFTIAHTTTLGLSSYGIVSLPARVVEPLIAFSIAYVAIENILRPKLTPARLVIVFCFGLLHGLGFASSLSEVPLPRNQFFTALLAFNFGVDFGQLFVIATAFLLVGWFRNQPWYRPRIVVPGCAVIAAVGLYWTVTRIFF